MGIEDFSGQDFSKFKSLQEMPSNMVFGIQATSLKSGGKSSTKAVTKTTKAENQESLKKTLESFQDAMRGLCISEIELNLGFSVSAKSWVVVNEEVAASAKIILGESSYV
jgi:hypothetical protein